MISSSTPALLLQNDASSKTMANTLSDTDAVSCVVVHPLVLLSVLDHHTRRQEGAGRVIGTLLGRRDGEKVRAANKFNFRCVHFWRSLFFVDIYWYNLDIRVLWIYYEYILCYTYTINSNTHIWMDGWMD